MSTHPAIIHIDGAARGNPGPAAYAFVISRHGEPPVEGSGLLGDKTNNVAEYTALVNALEKAAELSLERLHIHSDSELLVKQMNGEYRVKSAELRDFYDQAQQFLRRFKSVKIDHVRREQNKRADELCNIALDGGKTRARPGPAKDSTGAKMSLDGLRDDCVACLAAARSAWGAHDADAPTPAQVWEQLWSILEESGALKKTK